MTPWTPKGKLLSPTRFGDVVPLDVLLDFEGPRIFSFRNPDDELLLAYQIGETDDEYRYLIVQANEDLISDLRDGHLSILQAIDQPRAWVLDISTEWRPVRAWSEGGLVSLPQTVLPSPGVTLRNKSAPLFSVRAIGRDLKQSAVPASVVTRVVTNSTRALRRLIGYAKNELGQLPSGGKVWDYLSDPPVAFRFASFEVSFQSPPEDRAVLFRGEDTSVLPTLGALLTSGLTWATSKDLLAPGVPGRSEDERELLLQCLMDLTPPTTGKVDRVEIGGTLVGGGSNPITLTREARRIVIETLGRLTAPPKQQRVSVAGTVAYVDWIDRKMRVVDDFDKEHFFFFGDDLFEDANEAHQNRYRVQVSAVEDRRGNLTALELSPQADQFPKT